MAHQQTTRRPHACHCCGGSGEMRRGMICTLCKGTGRCGSCPRASQDAGIFLPAA